MMKNNTNGGKYIPIRKNPGQATRAAITNTSPVGSPNAVQNTLPVATSVLISTSPPSESSQKPAKKVVKKSAGVICMRLSAAGPEFLMVRKRYTYAYSLFLYGKYDLKRINDNVYMRDLFSQMTLEEKLIILSMNFQQMWYHVWLNTRFKFSYDISKSKFESNFLLDGGERLKRYITTSDSSKLFWEIPKGRIQSGEQPLNAAIREFNEETNLSIKDYFLFPEAEFTSTWTDVGVTYQNKYYPAYMKHKKHVGVNFANFDQCNEISDVQWISYEEIKRMDEYNRISHLLPRVARYVRKRI